MRHDGWREAVRRDEGISLVEAMLAVTILGIAATGLMWGLLAFVVESHRTEQNADANLVLIQFTEALRVQALYVAQACPAIAGETTTPYDATESNLAAWGVAPLPSGWDASTIVIESIRYWVADASAFVERPTGDSAEEILQCIRLRTARLQEVTVEVNSPDGRARASMAVVKRGG